jgi:hypothetical protein
VLQWLCFLFAPDNEAATSTWFDMVLSVIAGRRSGYFWFGSGERDEAETAGSSPPMNAVNAKKKARVSPGLP